MTNRLWFHWRQMFEPLPVKYIFALVVIPLSLIQITGSILDMRQTKLVSNYDWPLGICYSLRTGKSQYLTVNRQTKWAIYTILYQVPNCEIAREYHNKVCRVYGILSP